MDLVTFLRARLDEDEQVARFVEDGPGEVQRRGLDPLRVYERDEARFAYLTVDPARVLAEVDAKRKLLGSHYDYRGVCTRCFDWQNKPVEREQFPCEVVRLLALPYADHPDYDQTWRP